MMHATLDATAAVLASTTTTNNSSSKFKWHRVTDFDTE
jgi:hypothetical protein